jgi:tetratricopeptide (TPR) repeat protein
MALPANDVRPSREGTPKHSDIFELARPVKQRRPQPSPETARFLAELSIEHSRSGDLESARAAAYDAVELLDLIDDERASARVSLLVGEALLPLHDAHRARDAFLSAARTFDEAGDLPGAARARFGLGRALQDLGDPSARVVLEDAGTLYEDLGDEEAMRAIDRALRVIAADLEESPKSFVAASHLVALRR